MTSHRPLGWQPDRTWLFVVGTLEWQDSDSFVPFPKPHRRDAALVAGFRAAGVPPEQITYLKDRQATTQRIQRELEAMLPRARAGDLLVLYYCGHGDRADDGAAYFASYNAGVDADPGWVVDTIAATIARRFGGASALLLADCCCSGSLADAIARHAGRVAFACLASSLANETSTGNWTFTEGLVAGIRGQAFVDSDSDGAITLRELAAQIAESMAFAEEQLVTFATAGVFDGDMVIASARPRRDPRVGARVAVRSEGSWYPAQIVDARAGQLKVHYYGYDDGDDEWVAPERIRDVKRTSYPVGTRVEVSWKRRWYPAAIREVRSGIHMVHYDDYGSEWDEWVPSKRIRPLA